MKAFIFNFKNAGWFFENSVRSGDYLFDINGQQKRREFKKQYKEPITVHQISNMLHVIFGERPSASLRNTLIKPIPEIKEIALNSWIKIDDYSLVSKNEIVNNFSEKIRITKSIPNSWHPKNTLLHWKRIEIFLEKELYDKFIELVKKVFKINNPYERELADVIKDLHFNYLNNENVVSFLGELRANNKTPFFDTINGKFENAHFNQTSTTRITVCFGVSNIVRLRGKIIVPVKDEKWIEKFKNFEGTARLLDGGLVTLEEIKDVSSIYHSDLVGFKKMSEISDELLN